MSDDLFLQQSIFDIPTRVSDIDELLPEQRDKSLIPFRNIKSIEHSFEQNHVALFYCPYEVSPAPGYFLTSWNYWLTIELILSNDSLSIKGNDPGAGCVLFEKTVIQYGAWEIERLLKNFIEKKRGYFSSFNRSDKEAINSIMEWVKSLEKVYG